MLGLLNQSAVLCYLVRNRALGLWAESSRAHMARVALRCVGVRRAVEPAQPTEPAQPRAPVGPRQNSATPCVHPAQPQHRGRIAQAARLFVDRGNTSGNGAAGKTSHMATT